MTQTITLNQIPCAIGFTPANPPPPWILHTWITLAGAAWTPAGLRDALGSGQPVELVKGWSGRWVQRVTKIYRR